MDFLEIWSHRRQGMVINTNYVSSLMYEPICFLQLLASELLLRIHVRIVDFNNCHFTMTHCIYDFFAAFTPILSTGLEGTPD